MVYEEEAEKAISLLEDNGGEMQQKRLLEEFGWSNAKTSNVVSHLDEKGDLNAYQLGRENTLYLPKETPDLIKNP